MKKAAVFLLLLAGVAGLLAQHQPPVQDWYRQADAQYNLDEPTTATDSLALQLFLQVAGHSEKTDAGLAVKSLIKAANIHQGYQRFAEANEYYHRAITLNQRQLRDTALLYEAYLYLGSSHYFANVVDSARHFFEQASSFADAFRRRSELPEQDRLYNSLGAIYYESADYVQAKNYFTKALRSSTPGSNGYEELYAGIQSNIASCLMKLNRFDSALRIFRVLPPAEAGKQIIRQNTAHAYFELGRYDSALSIYRSLPYTDGYGTIVALTNMGRIYMNRKQWRQAEAVFDSAIARNKKISPTLRNKEEALAYLYRSQLASSQGLSDEALTWINTALEEVHLDFQWRRPTDLPADVAKTVSPITLFSILHTKAGLLYGRYRQGGDAALLGASVATYKKAIETANFIKSHFDNDEARLFFNQNYKPIYNEAVQAAYDAIGQGSAVVDDYLFLVENYKGNVLHQNLQTVLQKAQARIPAAVKQRERELRQLLAFYTSKINQSSSDSDALQLQNRLLSVQVELSRLQKTYEQDEAYNRYRRQYGGDAMPLAQLQERIDGNTAMIHYYEADSALFVLAVTCGDVLLKRLAKPAAWQQTLKAFVDEVYSIEEGRRYNGYGLSAQLYQWLLQLVEDITDGAERWVVLPDGPLHYLPFEALAKNAQDRDYLLQQKAVSYHYSFALLFGGSASRNAAQDRPTLAFAPFSADDDRIRQSGWAPLPLSKTEVQHAGTEVFVGAAATRRMFLQKAARYGVVHLATHASIGADSTYNWIQFYPSGATEMDSRIYLHDVYNLNLPAVDLVVLSACETAGGASAGGEGLLSLSRAFLYAGAGGIVSTLWKTEDRVTAYLMQRMHRFLDEGKSPPEALRLAKLALLGDESIGEQYKTPNYWANFIYVGKLPPPAGGGWWKPVAAAALLIGGAGWWWMRYRKRRLRARN